MGWTNEAAPEHEGYLVGIVPAVNRDGTTSDWRFRELCFDTDGERRDGVPLSHVQVGCECGWRSPRLSAPRDTRWYPSIVELPRLQEQFEDECRLRWREHVASECARRSLRPSSLVEPSELWPRR